MTTDELRELAEALRSSAKVDPVLWGMATKAAAILERLVDDKRAKWFAKERECNCADCSVIAYRAWLMMGED